MSDAIDDLRQEIKWLQDTILERDKQLAEARALLELVIADNENTTELTLPEIRTKIRAFLHKPR